MVYYLTVLSVLQLNNVFFTDMRKCKALSDGWKAQNIEMEIYDD